MAETMQKKDLLALLKRDAGIKEKVAQLRDEWKDTAAEAIAAHDIHPRALMVARWLYKHRDDAEQTAAFLAQVAQFAEWIGVGAAPRAPERKVEGDGASRAEARAAA
jgi:hypothetical protein